MRRIQIKAIPYGLSPPLEPEAEAAFLADISGVLERHNATERYMMLVIQRHTDTSRTVHTTGYLQTDQKK